MILIPKYSNIIEIGGTIAIAHYNSDGELIDDRFYSNIVVTVGKNYIAQRMVDLGPGATGTLPTKMTHMALGGHGTPGTTVAKTSPTVSVTQLSTSSGGVTIGERARVGLINPTNDGTSNSNNSVVTYQANFGAGIGTGALVEAGIFNSGTAASGTMLCITSFDVVNKAAQDSIAITWTVTIQ